MNILLQYLPTCTSCLLHSTLILKFYWSLLKHFWSRGPDDGVRENMYVIYVKHRVNSCRTWKSYTPAVINWQPHILYQSHTNHSHSHHMAVHLNMTPTYTDLASPLLTLLLVKLASTTQASTFLVQGPIMALGSICNSCIAFGPLSIWCNKWFDLWWECSWLNCVFWHNTKQFLEVVQEHIISM